jgi:hypothetical protein
MMPWTKKIRFVNSVLACLGGAGCLGLLATAAVAQTAVMPASLPLYFEANQGQVDSPAQFIARGCDSQFLISPGAAQLVLCKMTAPRTFSARAMRMQFVGANGRAPISGAEELSGKINYLIGNNPARWQTGVATFARVRVGGLYPGINLSYYGSQRQLEYDFTVAPDADPGVIAIRFDGADKISVNPAGELVLNLGDSEIRQPKPVLYQTVHGARREIGGGYKILDAQTVAFAVGGYDRSLPLVIDPILSYSTYFGGNATDLAAAVAVDTNGFIYMTGQTFSTQFLANQPFATAGAFQTNYQGSAYTGDGFVAKFDNTGSNLVYLTYLGGTADNVPLSLAVDSSGHAYVAGYTDSADFPTTSGALQKHIAGTVIQGLGDYLVDAFVSELGPAGNLLVYSTFLGGSAVDGATGIAVDASGNAYITGFTSSTDFPVTANAIQKHLQCPNSIYWNANAFVAKIGAGGSSLIYSTYLGGINFDQGAGIAVDSANCAYVTGFTASTNFPTTNFIHQVIGLNLYYGGWLNGFGNNINNNGYFANDAFVTKFSPAGTNLVYSTFLGGANNDVASSIAVDAAGNAYVTGWTVSTNFPNPVAFPSLPNGLANNLVYGYSATTNAFLTKIMWNGTNANIGYSAVFGGTNYGVIDTGQSVAVDASGDAFVAGTTSSTNFPTFLASNAGFLRATNSGGNDVFVTAFNPNATALLYSVYLGGVNNDFGNGLALDPAGNAYVVGQTLSANFPTVNALHVLLDGPSDAFLAKILLASHPTLTILPQPTSDVTLAWRAFQPEYKLESNTNLAVSNAWLVVPQPPVLSNGWHTVILPATNANLFFRLQKF